MTHSDTIFDVNATKFISFDLPQQKEHFDTNITHFDWLVARLFTHIMIVHEAGLCAHTNHVQITSPFPVKKRRNLCRSMQLN